MAELPDISKTEVAIVEQTNAFRRAEKLEPLKRDPMLDRAARQFALYLAKSGRFAHEADGRQPGDRAKEAGYWYCTIAENLALNLDSRGFTVEKLARETVEGWKQSPGHRKNMLLPHVTEIGVGTAQAMGSDPKFLTVQLFGRPLSLAYEFKVMNKSTFTVQYTFAGKSERLDPHVTATHKSCDPGKITFSAGSWISGTKLDASYVPRAGSVFVVRPGPDGKARVEVKF
ncbi:MAG: CAP domain-containing protein [Hyphomicrobiaceae bacterium]